MANALTAVRLFLVLPFAFFMAHGDARSVMLALAAWVVAVTTDLLDGPIARRRGTVTALSGAFDHTSDFLFVTSGLFGGAVRGVFPWEQQPAPNATISRDALAGVTFHFISVGARSCLRVP